MKQKLSRGQSLVEFALIIPLFLLIVVGTLDIGRLIYTYSVMHNAAREGARYGAVHPCDDNGITTAAERLTSGLNGPLAVSVTRENMDSLAESRIIVRVDYSFDLITPLVGVFWGSNGTISLSNQALHHIENTTATCN